MTDVLRVITGCSQRKGLLAKLESQLRDAGIPFFCEVDPDAFYPGTARLMGEYVGNMRRWLDKWGDAENLVFCDAWDVLFYGTLEEVAAKVPETGILMAAEKNCYPDAYLGPFFLDRGPWRFNNCGLLAGKPTEVDNWLTAVEKHPAYHPRIMDQQWFNYRLLDAENDFPVDHWTSLFYCYFMDQGELQVQDGHPVNTITKARPNFVHFNGKTEPTNFFLRYGIDQGVKITIRKQELQPV